MPRGWYVSHIDYKGEKMKAVAGVCLGLIGVLLVCAVIMFSYVIGTLNREATVRVQFEAQQKVNESSFDKTWKIIKQQSGVANTERDSFRQTYTEIMTATKGVAGNGQLASFFTQAKVDISPQLFSQLMTTIESQRESFHRDQQKLLQIQAEHDKCFEVQPSGMILSMFGRQNNLKAKLVTSSKTNEAFETGEDNDTDL